MLGQHRKKGGLSINYTNEVAFIVAIGYLIVSTEY